ncbi:winged helix-turn-helix transcriptional regulator [Aquimarina sp. MMG015]|uniref:MarR family winged helix-turn-helix transcriptional regulator n=1 Tax=Aquimarina TaxID=290174 RepID=UPI000402FD7B|nr:MULTISPECIES: MarR family winged helix-turn-helix transcriptional regulator [Aquimarina]AXT58447.1 MarR family transcriptional regulator [Aquimarina sp. AD1]MBQ4805707.1 winged helix-turn-helix transcriptional regulator [Aquimarina sp. MMG015]RKN16805.1 MarR family transcriptional regulator [Aquimarina sp. AD1]
MDKSIFNIPFQHEDINAKIVIGLERISEIFRVLLWEYSKELKISPIQIQILIFVAYHKESQCTVSHLAKEFNLTKPTISDAVKVLEQKKLISKNKTSTDSRSYHISLTLNGKKSVSETENFANPIRKQIDTLNFEEQQSLFSTLSSLIYKLNKSGVLSVQRTCFACKFYEKKSETNDFCNLIQKDLSSNDIRLDCPEFEKK